MDCLKRWLLPLYYYGTWPIRLWYGHRLACRGCCPIGVVVFHRIADDKATPWTCSTEVFRRQIQWLRRRFELISLAEVQRRLRHKQSFRPAVHITFDDGYADNGRFALPWLLEQKIPCTYFVSVEQLQTGSSFPHDRAIGRFFPVHQPEELRQFAQAGLEIGCHSYSHRDLGPVTDPAILKKEILHARWELEQILDKPVRYFAFPFGQPENLNQQAFWWVQQAGYDAACSAYGAYNFPGQDWFHIRRIPADGWLLRLKHHLLFDPRRLSDSVSYGGLKLELSEQAKLPLGGQLHGPSSAKSI
ncbi:MAG: polysaccharide deacetylase family protein [Thermoguttaceae bacterium]|nr:polysaccharide deacetylase family protein [Thermoguttaceae bacterium]MDW8037719.1 polysaccharide deacetylase family protein [Thermoguttaceae bacterium]